MNDNFLALDSSLTLEQIEANFTGVDLYEQIMKALHEALEYERKSKTWEEKKMWQSLKIPKG